MTEVSGDPRTPPTEVSNEVNADISTHRFEPYDWQERLGVQVAANAARRAARQAERDQLNERRRHGLAARHNTKLNRATASPEPRSHQ